jgi:predicted transposase/invertase (TIGR01784 family)
MKEEVNQWLAFIDMERGDLLEMAKKENKEIKKAVEDYEVLTGKEEIKRLAELRLMSKLEENSALATARANGTEEGMKLGKEVEKKKIAKKLLEMGIEIEKIAKVTGLSIEKIKKIKNQ